MGILKRKWRLQKQASAAKKRKDMLGAYAKAILYTTKNGSFLAPVEDIEIGKKIGDEGSYDIHELTEIEKLLEPSSVVYVVGTHIGLLLVPVAKKAKTVIGYEANPQTYELLQMNIALNNLDNTRTYNYAAGDKEGEVEFYLNHVNSGGSKIKPKKDQFMYRFDKPKTVKVQMKPIDNHFVAEQIPRADIIIMDIEGAEYYALKGMQNTLSQSKALYIEFIPHHLQNVADVSSAEFLKLIVPHYNKVRFMKQPERLYDLQTDMNAFSTAIETMMRHQKDDNVLFYK